MRNKTGRFDFWKRELPNKTKREPVGNKTKILEKKKEITLSKRKKLNLPTQTHREPTEGVDHVRTSEPAKPASLYHLPADEQQLSRIITGATTSTD